jgi:hypothetical protein
MKSLKFISSLSAVLFIAVASEATPFFVDFGDNVEVRGVTRLEDGRAMLVGYRDVPTTEVRNAKLFTVSADGASFTETTLLGLGGHSVATSISANGAHIGGYSQSPGSADIGEGTVWSAANSWAPQGVGVGALFPSSLISDVSSNGVAVGDIEGARGAISWTEAQGLTNLESNFGNGGAVGVSDDGKIAVGLGSLTFGVASPLLWAGDGMEALETAEGNGVVRAISDNGLYVAGFTESFNAEIFQTFTNAALWVDSDGVISDEHGAEDYELLHLTDANGENFQGEVLAVSDNGYAVGGSEEGAFIWHASFAGVRLFDEWLLSEFGIDLPTPALAVHDVFFDGINLNFAVRGSAYFVSAPLGGGGTEVPEPASVLLFLGGLGLAARQRRSCEAS